MKSRDNGAPIVKKLFYRIAEVAQLTGVEPYVLRHWEQKYRSLRPRRTKSGQRLYNGRDIDTILKIKRLRYDAEFTTAGTQKQLRAQGLEPPRLDDPVVVQCRTLRQELLDVRQQLLDLLELV